MKGREPIMTKEFKNTWKQNITLFVVTIVIAFTLEAIFSTYAVHQFAHMINPHRGFTAILEFFVIFVAFFLPFKRVRKFVWNKAGSVFHIEKSTKVKESRTPKAVNGQEIHANEDLATFTKNVKVENQHYTIKL